MLYGISNLTTIGIIIINFKAEFPHFTIIIEALDPPSQKHKEKQRYENGPCSSPLFVDPATRERRRLLEAGLSTSGPDAAPTAPRTFRKGTQNKKGPPPAH